MEGLANAPLRCCGCLARLTLVPAWQVSRSFCLGQGQEGARAGERSPRAAPQGLAGSRSVCPSCRLQDTASAQPSLPGSPRPPARGPDISCVGAEESPAVVVTSVPLVGWQAASRAGGRDPDPRTQSPSYSPARPLGPRQLAHAHPHRRDRPRGPARHTFVCSRTSCKWIHTI